MGVGAWIRRRAWPLGVTGAFVAIGMAYSFLWLPLRHGTHAWATPPDLWATFRGAQFVEWGGFGAIYSAQTFLVTLPGMAVLLAPLAMVADHYNLSAGFPLPLAHPSAWLLVGPIDMLTVLPMLLAVDNSLQRLASPAWTRRLAVAGAAALSFPVLVMFGHPEDGLALALALFALDAAHDDRLRTSAWLMGASLAVQPLSVVVLPLALGFLGFRRAPAWLARALVLPTVLVGIVLAADWSDAVRVLLHQPNYPTAPANHATPWVHLAPVLTHNSVAAGPGRMIAMGLAALLVFWGIRSRGSYQALLVGATLALALRVPFEAVEVPYYLTPALFFALPLAARTASRLRLFAVSALVSTIVSFFHYGPWSYWTITVAAFSITLAAATGPARATLVRLGRRPLPGDGGEDPVDEAARILRRVQLGQLDGLVDDHADRRAVVVG
jgi:hypothetical protein